MTSFAEIKALLRNWPDYPVPVDEFPEHPHERLRNALLNLDCTTPSDLATLVRHVLRFEQMHHSGVQRLAMPRGESWPTAEQWRIFGCRVRQVNGILEVEAEAWEPDWLTILQVEGDLENTPNPFAAVEAGKVKHPRVSDSESWQVRADPTLRSAFQGFTHYLSSAQAETVRTAMLSPPGATRLIVLPTGSGKSLVGMAYAFLGKVQQGVALVIVPTIALAFDQVEQARNWRPGGDSIDAWHSGLSKAQRKAIRERLRAGTQRLLFLAPESLRVLKDDLCCVASSGWLRSLVVDEAHLISQWGGSFRPDMQLMSAILKELRKQCPPGREFRTLLMTATLTNETYADLIRLFGSMETLAAVHLRPEPDYFQARCNTDVEKTNRVLETLRHAPRPAILYVTKVEDAKQWHRRCLNQGWLRTGLVHGESTASERERVITQWREDQLDLMVATSAFGLGMDKGDVRLVLHACVPETLDRFYQEVGRGGRDGRASVSVMIWTSEDFGRARRMSTPDMIGNELGLDRWKAMWTSPSRTDHGEISYLNLRSTRVGLAWDSERNIEWNLRTLLLLIRAGVLELHELPAVNLARMSGENDKDYHARLDKARAQAEATCAVSLVESAPNTEKSWEERVGTFRQQSMQASVRNWQRMEDVLNGDRRLNDVLREVYRVPDAGIHDVGLEPIESEVPSPPKDLCLEVRKGLKNATSAAINGLLILTYRTSGLSLYDILRRQILILKSLVAHGVREIALPSQWVERSHWDEHPNPLTDLTRQSIEGFIIVRDLDEPDPWAWQPNLPRLSLVMPDITSVPNSLYSIQRPLHLLMIPEERLDPAHPSRRIGDSRPNVMQLEDIARLLKL